MKYNKIFALLIVVLAVALSVPGCGKKNDEKKPGGPGGSPASIINGFSYSGGSGQATILSLNTCYNITRSSDGSMQFPIATSPTQPHTVYSGYLIATAYVANTAYNGGNHYYTQNSRGDRIDVYISQNDLYLSGVVYLTAATVRDIQRYLGKSETFSTLCVDGVNFPGAQINGSLLSSSYYGYTTLYVNDYPVLYF